MKKLFAAAAIIAVLAVTTGCVAVRWDSNMRNSVRGEGVVTSGEYEVGAYDAVDIRSMMRVVYSAEPSTKIRLDIQENIRQYVTFGVEDGVLIIDSDRSIVVPSLGETPTLYIYNPNLKAMYVSGAITMKDSEPIAGESFKLEVSGAGDINLALDVARFEADLYGAANLNLRGSAEDADISIAGAGNIDALDLQTKRARMQLSGVGSASISCSDELDVNVSAVGSLRYRGNPNVRQNVSGVGSIRRID